MLFIYTMILYFDISLELPVILSFDIYPELPVMPVIYTIKLYFDISSSIYLPSALSSIFGTSFLPILWGARDCHHPGPRPIFAVFTSNSAELKVPRTLLRVRLETFDFDLDLVLKLGQIKPKISGTVPAHRHTTIPTASGPISVCFENDPKLLNCETAQPNRPWCSMMVIPPLPARNASFTTTRMLAL